MQIAADGTAEITAVSTAPIPSGRAYELWPLQGPDQPPVALGLAPTAAPARLALPAAFEEGTEFAVSDEPAVGSPAAGPTGLVLFVGGLVRPENN